MHYKHFGVRSPNNEACVSAGVMQHEVNSGGLSCKKYPHFCLSGAYISVVYLAATTRDSNYPVHLVVQPLSEMPQERHVQSRTSIRGRFSCSRKLKINK